jgi:hypothetical protein
MRILKTILFLILLINLTVSCTPDEIEKDSEQQNIIDPQATGAEGADVDQTVKGK